MVLEVEFPRLVIFSRLSTSSEVKSVVT
jgi:hypothetical protein